MKRITYSWLLSAFLLLSQTAFGVDPETEAGRYVLGADDQLLIRVLDVEEITDKPVRVDMRGNINLPVVGRLHVAGKTVEQLEEALIEKLKKTLNDPQVTVTVSEFRPQPVSVLGSVKTPGVLQVTGEKTLYEVLSLAGGLNSDAGHLIKITRRKAAGPLPLPNAVDDPTGRFHIAEVSVKSVMEAKSPDENIQVLPYDVVSVPKAELIYIIGAVTKSGGFVLAEKENISVLQALSLAEGLDRMAAPKNAKILRPIEGKEERQEIAVNLAQVLDGRSGDVPLRANDILFVPTSKAKGVAIRGLEAAIQMGTGIAIYSRR